MAGRNRPGPEPLCLRLASLPVLWEIKDRLELQQGARLAAFYASLAPGARRWVRPPLVSA